MQHQATVQCPDCKTPNTRDIEPLHPGGYTNEEDAGISSTFWCNGCACSITARYSFSLDSRENIKVTVTEVKKDSSKYQLRPFSGITIRPKQKSYKS
tara:strand:- start:8790 stop:9080 length:291 start_codon:yes stop_codon:yes gene_type:complete